ncbi:MAG: hypothetical protein JWR00_268, partial [Rubritepida sp.]|nr:hypothetical protein [Rubritepida sp.]
MTALLVAAAVTRSFVRRPSLGDRIA